MGVFAKELTIPVLSEQTHYYDGHNIVYFENIILTPGEKTITISVVQRGSYKKRRRVFSIDKATWSNLIQQWLQETTEKS